MLGFSPLPIIFILVIVFLIFGAGKLPEIGSGFGKAIKNFKNSLSGKDEIDVTPEDSGDDETPVKAKKRQITRISSSRVDSKKTKRTGSKTVKAVKK